MSNKEEENYFMQQELERHEQLRRQKALEALRSTEREGIKASLNTSEEIAEEALSLGFSAQTARVLPLLPLIQVAWADGSVSLAEERVVLELATARGIEKDSSAYEFLENILNDRPSDLFFERTNRVIAKILDQDSTSWSKMSVLELAKEVADASGGFFGLTKRIGKQERELLDDLASKLDVNSSADSLSVFGDE